MKFLMRKCPKCGRYTFKEVCPICGARTVSAHPPRFSPTDKYVRYRVVLRELSRNTYSTTKVHS